MALSSDRQAPWDKVLPGSADHFLLVDVYFESLLDDGGRFRADATFH